MCGSAVPVPCCVVLFVYVCVSCAQFVYVVLCVLQYGRMAMPNPGGIAKNQSFNQSIKSNQCYDSMILQ